MANGPESFVTWSQLDRELVQLRGFIDERNLGQQRALEISTVETQRRLHELNHAHQAAMENWRTSLPRELFENEKVALQRWRDQVNEELIRIKTLAEQKAIGNQRLIAVIGTLLVALSIGLRFIGR